jgi:hypothetical protein
MSDDLKTIDFTQTTPIDPLQNININLNPESQEKNLIQNISTSIIKENSNSIASNFVDNATNKLEKTTIEKLLCFLNYFRDYFKVTTNDIKKRLILSFNPLKNQFYEEISNKPDLYGPFWIYTTLIFVICAGGSLSKYFQGADTENFFTKFVPTATSIIYSIGFLIPLVIYLAYRFLNYNKDNYTVQTNETIENVNNENNNNVDNNNNNNNISNSNNNNNNNKRPKYMVILCIYGYSLTPFIPVMILCSCGIEFIQWIFLVYGFLSSTGFVLINLWLFIENQSEPKKKFALIGFVIFCQIILFLILKFYFFEEFKKNIN